MDVPKCMLTHCLCVLMIHRVSTKSWCLQNSCIINLQCNSEIVLHHTGVENVFYCKSVSFIYLLSGIKVSCIIRALYCVCRWAWWDFHCKVLPLGERSVILQSPLSFWLPKWTKVVSIMALNSYCVQVLV